MAFARARTALAQLEEKLRRQLNLAGEVGATFQPVLTPVIITGDLREAGNASNVGRAFALGVQFGAAANDGFSVRNEVDVFYDLIGITASAATASYSVWITAPSQAPALVVLNLAGTWTDRKTIVGDQVPLTIPAAFGPVVGTIASTTNRIFHGTIPVNNLTLIPANIMLPAGAALNFQTGTGVNAGVMLRGRIWP